MSLGGWRNFRHSIQMVTVFLIFLDFIPWFYKRNDLWYSSPFGVYNQPKLYILLKYNYHWRASLCRACVRSDGNESTIMAKRVDRVALSNGIHSKVHFVMASRIRQNLFQWHYRSKNTVNEDGYRTTNFMFESARSKLRFAPLRRRAYTGVARVHWWRLGPSSWIVLF